MFIHRSAHASNYRAPQLPPVVQNAVERSAETTSDTNDAHHYHHQHYYIDGSTPKYHIDEQLLLAQRNQMLAQKRADTKPITTLQYKPRVGEILAKDSVMYKSNKTPVTRQYATIQLKPATTTTLRRSNLWPIVDNTVTSLATKAAASANAVKNLLKIGFVNTFDNVNAAVEHKRQKIKSYLIQAAQDHQFALQQAAEDENHQQQQELQQQLHHQHHHHQQLSGGHQLGTNQQQYPLKSAITQQIPLTSHAATNGAHHSLLLKPLHHLIPLKQQLTQNVIQHIAKHLKKPRMKKPTAPIIVYTTKTKPLPTTTISEDYIHTYDNNYIPPKFFDGGKNPYADMGVTSYKHFEDTILKELEEKEERKVEATIHTMLDDKYVTNESLEGTKPGISQLTEWSPINSNDDLSSSFFGTSSPAPILNVGNYIQSTFDRPFNDVRPVCEHTDDIVVQPTLFVFPATAESQTNTEQQAASNDNAVSVKPNAANQTNSTTTEKPNYPAYFIKQQQQLKKLQQKLVGGQRLAKQPIQIPNKTQQRNKYNFKSRNTMQRQSPTTTTTTASDLTAASDATTQLPTTTTSMSSLLFYTANGTDDDGFQPINPPTELLRSNKSRKLSRNKFNETITTLSPTVRPKTSASIQAQASHVSITIVSPSNANGNARTTGKHSHTNTSQYTRKAPKKQTKLIKDSTNGTNSTATAKSYQNINKNQFRGSIKFSDSLHESP